MSRFKMVTWCNRDHAEVECPHKHAVKIAEMLVDGWVEKGDYVEWHSPTPLVWIGTVMDEDHEPTDAYVELIQLGDPK